MFLYVDCLCGVIISLDSVSRVAHGGRRSLSQRRMDAVCGARARMLRGRATESKPATDGGYAVEIVQGQGRDHIGHPRYRRVEKTHVIPCPAFVGGGTVCDGTLEGVRAVRILFTIYGPVRDLPANAGQRAPASAVIGQGDDDGSGVVRV
jgi:hypothetical protein